MRVYKRKLKNDHIQRDFKRATASKNSIWYDIRLCQKGWCEAIKDLLKTNRDAKKNFKTRIRASALLKVADCIESQGIVAVQELHALYKSECRKELLFYHLKDLKHTDFECNAILEHFHKIELLQAGHKIPEFSLDGHLVQTAVEVLGKIPRYTYMCSDARDLFSTHLPVVMVYQRVKTSIEAFMVKRHEGIGWAKMIDELKWPSMETVFREQVSHKLHELIKPALSYASEKDRHILKLILLKMTSSTYLNKHGLGGAKFGLSSLKRVENEAVTLTQWFDRKKDMSRHQLKKVRNKTGDRALGSGRLLLSEIYPRVDLVNDVHI